MAVFPAADRHNCGMTTRPIEEPAQGLAGESASLRAARTARESGLIGRGRAQIEAGFGIALDALEEWLGRLDQDENTPSPIAQGDNTPR
jgi:hypothetical protein